MLSELLEVSSEIPIEPPEVSNINFTEETNMKKSKSTQNYSQPSCSFSETLQIISPKPTRPKQTKRVVRRKETSKILTSTPVKDALERQEEDRKKIVKPKPRTELQTNKKIKIVKSKPNRKEMEASTSKIQDESSEESDSASDVDCLYCVSKYSASRGEERWIQCQGCRNWAHEECAGIDDFEDEFLCLILEKGIKGFETSGIFPYNRDIFDETDFMLSELLEVSSEIPIEPPEVSNINFTEETNMKKSKSTQNYSQPSCSFSETLQIISPKPTRPKQTKRVVRRKETSKILTNTPVKDALERQEEDRKKIVKPKPRTELQTNKKIKIVKSKPNRKEMEASTSKIQDESSEESDSASDVDCLYCVSKYSASRGGEGWIQCQGCRNWAHEECAGIDDFEDEFLCLICNN
ncbi:hypothetical protein RN001_015143 [Aquatica leii]|uniref:Zinc finger PHD-type domain-containing protein n=1 Tax=Aquatica leii TaxID=1421715 RepID=A0AAN7NYV1_9COLE|nr:hypothetical protein RN001_015143 [Aquatica leii]